MLVKDRYALDKKKTIVSLFVICRLWIYPFVGTQSTLTSKEKANNNDSKLFFIFLDFCVVLLCVFTFWVPCCDVRYNFRIETMIGSSLPPGLMSYLRYLSLFVYSGVQHILCCVFGWFFFVLCTLCCQFLWIVHF